MKIFQIKNNVCYNDITFKFPTLASTIGKIPSTVLLVEAPNYVQEGWGFDISQEGNARFLQPEPPEGWVYDLETNTYYPVEEKGDSIK